MKTKLYEKIWHNISFDQLNKNYLFFEKYVGLQKIFIKFKNAMI